MPIEVLGGFSGATSNLGFDIGIGSSPGVWFFASQSISSVPIGYNHLTTLSLQSLSDANCDPNSLGLVELSATDSEVNSQLVLERQNVKERKSEFSSSNMLASSPDQRAGYSSNSLRYARLGKSTSCKAFDSIKKKSTRMPNKKQWNIHSPT